MLLDTAQIAALLRISAETARRLARGPSFPAPASLKPRAWNGVDVLVWFGLDETTAKVVLEEPANEPRSAKAKNAEKVLHEALTARLHGARRRSKRKSRECGVTLDLLKRMHEKQLGRCAVSGIAFDLTGGTGGPFAPSLDRIDNSVGYEEGNVRLVCHAVNLMMNRWGDAVFHDLIRKMKERDQC